MYVKEGKRGFAALAFFTPIDNGACHPERRSREGPPW
jgi:hypothetical protein